jgi:cyclopropane fatty-acyl-phospholipid synthase-like methyltransferase
MDPSQDEGNCQQDSEKTADTEKMNVTEEQMLLEHMEDKRMSHVWTVYSWRMRLNSCSPQAVKIFGQRKSVLYIHCTTVSHKCDFIFNINYFCRNKQSEQDYCL